MRSAFTNLGSEKTPVLVDFDEGQQGFLLALFLFASRQTAARLDRVPSFLFDNE